MKEVSGNYTARALERLLLLEAQLLFLHAKHTAECAANCTTFLIFSHVQRLLLLIHTDSRIHNAICQVRNQIAHQGNNRIEHLNG